MRCEADRLKGEPLCLQDKHTYAVTFGIVTAGLRLQLIFAATD